MKKGNKGFSLVEVMIAITILAIIVTPFLASFLRATKINAKSRKMLRATTVAENVMEGLSGFLIEDISKQFNNSYFLQAKDADGKPLVDASGKPVLESDSSFLILSNRGDDDAFTYEELGPNKTVVTEVDGVPVDRDKRVFTQKPGNVYEYIIRNVTEDKQKFDVKITVDANKYRDVAAEKLQTGQDYNIAAGKMFNVSEMNPKTDIVWAEPVGIWNKYVEDYATQLKNANFYQLYNPDLDAIKEAEETREKILESIDNKTFLSNCSRTFSLLITDDLVSIEVFLQNDKYDYGCQLETTKKYFPSITSASQRANLKNIFLCYYPNYELNKEIIQITDLTGIDNIMNQELMDSSQHYNIYIIKQEADALSNENEKNYKVDLNIYTSILGFKEMPDGDPEIVDALIRKFGEEKVNEYGYPFSIRGNLGHYFEKENPAPSENQGIIEGDDGTKQVSFQMKYSSGIIDTPGVPISEEILKKMDVVDGIIRYSGVDKSTKNLIYNTTVDVYEAGAYNATDGTFDETKHIAKLDSEQAEIE